MLLREVITSFQLVSSRTDFYLLDVVQEEAADVAGRLEEGEVVDVVCNFHPLRVLVAVSITIID